MEHEVQIPVQVQGPVNTIEVEALLDSSATGCFVDKSWALDRRLWLSKLMKPVPVLNVDGTRNYHDWLKKHNPDIDWTTGDVKLSHCPPECKSLMDTHFTKLISDNESQEMWIQALKNHESKGDVDESTLEEAQKLVPHEYWDYLDVFSKLKSECMPLRKPW
ncbi:hypothetical protein SCLCIDRAFT_136399, partial [Scleroderma citrinum Foug A]